MAPPSAPTTPTACAHAARPNGRRRAVHRALVPVALLVLAACISCSPPAEDSMSPTTASDPYRAEQSADPHVPTGVTSAPVVVMIPGGSWQSADPAGLAPLAEALADRGVVAVPVTIRAAQDGVVHPTPVEDVLCALAHGAAVASEAGIRPSRLVLLGHSSGAHLSAVATLAPDRYDPTCEDPVVRPDALVGLAGPYDIRDFADAAAALFAPAADAAERDAANPVLLAGHRPEVPVLLLHGEADEVVPASFSTDFGTALRDGGHPTTVTVLPEDDHGSIYSAETAAAPVADWLASLPQPSGG
jgi:acetyl esterase/lipase